MASSGSNVGATTVAEGLLPSLEGPSKGGPWRTSHPPWDHGSGLQVTTACQECHKQPRSH